MADLLIDPSSHHRSTSCLPFPDDVTRFNVLPFCDAVSLAQLSATSKRLRKAAQEDELWVDLYDNQFAAFPHYARTNKRAAQWAAAGRTAQEQFLLARTHSAQTHLTEADMSLLMWRFTFNGHENFVPPQYAHFISSQTSSSEQPKNQFPSLRSSHLKLGHHYLAMEVGFPALRWNLSEGGHSVCIEDFPPHKVTRTADRRWQITNENVTFVSVESEEVPENRRDCALARQVRETLGRKKWAQQERIAEQVAQVHTGSEVGCHIQ